MTIKAPSRMTSGRGRYVARVRHHGDNVRLATGRMLATGGLAAAVRASAPPDVLVLVCVLVLFGMWVITDPQRTDQLVKIINALKGPGNFTARLRTLLPLGQVADRRDATARAAAGTTCGLPPETTMRTMAGRLAGVAAT